MVPGILSSWESIKLYNFGPLKKIEFLCTCNLAVVSSVLKEHSDCESCSSTGNRFEMCVGECAYITLCMKTSRCCSITLCIV